MKGPIPAATRRRESGLRGPVRGLLLLLILLVVAASGVLLPPAWGAGPSRLFYEWSSPVPLSGGARSWFPDVAVDLSGRAHVVWASHAPAEQASEPDDDAVIHTASADGHAWTASRPIARLAQRGSTEVTRPALVFDATGTAHLTFRRHALHYATLTPTVLGLLSPRPRVVHLSAGELAYYSRIAFDTRGRAHLVFTQNGSPADGPDCGGIGCYRVLYRRADDAGGDWSWPVHLSTTTPGAAKPQIVVDGADRVHVAWEAGRGGGLGQLVAPAAVMYTGSTDGGRTWRVPVPLTPPASDARNVALGLDGAGMLVMVWLDVAQDRVRFVASADQGQTWSATQPLPGVWGGASIYRTPVDTYTLAGGRPGRLHLALVGRTAREDRPLRVLHVMWDRGRWSAPEIVVTLSGDVPEWPRLAVGPAADLHAVWFVRDAPHVWDSSVGRYRIWYAHGKPMPRASESRPDGSPAGTTLPVAWRP